MKVRELLSVIAVLAACLAPAEAQTPSLDESEGDAIVRFEPDRPDYFDAAASGMTEVSAPGQLYSLLESFCRPDNSAHKAGMPCAYISYAPPGTSREAAQDSLRPVFRVLSQERIWTFYDARVALVTRSVLENATDLRDTNDPARTEPYVPTAVMGATENERRCKAGLPCIDTSFAVALFSDRTILTPGCIQEIWHRGGGPRGPGEQSRCRFKRL